MCKDNELNIWGRAKHGCALEAAQSNTDHSETGLYNQGIGCRRVWLREFRYSVVLKQGVLSVLRGANILTQFHRKRHEHCWFRGL